MAEHSSPGRDVGRRDVGPPAGTEPRTGIHKRDLVRWGPVIAGVLVTIATLVVLTVLGLAIGLSAFEPGEVGEADTAATIYGIASFLIAFFLGGFAAAKTAAVGGPEGGSLNGVMVGITSIALLVLLVGLGIGNALGAAATNLDQIAEVVRDAQVGAGEAQEAAETAFEDAEAGAWGTLVGLLVAMAAAALGGLVGKRPADPARPVGDR